MSRRIVTRTLSKEDKINSFEKLSEKPPDVSFYPRAAKAEISSIIEKVLRHEDIKRFIDIIGAVVGLVIFSPILTLSIVLICLSGSKKIFFKQERVGRFGKPFMLYKFTTMIKNAHIDGPLVSKAGDARITKIGKFLRSTSVNELPQFINVLKGDMSIVGPRPEAARYVKYWSPAIKKKILSIKPGITGHATLRYWKESEVLTRMNNFEEYYIKNVMPEKLQLELWYGSNWNLLLDIKIMLQTLYKAFNGDRKEESRQENPNNVKTKRFRMQPRVPIDVVAYLEVNDKVAGYVTPRNISSSGVLIETEKPLQVGTKIYLNFKLPSRSSPIKTFCEIKWTKKSTHDKTICMGVQFVNITATEEGVLRNYLESRFSGHD